VLIKILLLLATFAASVAEVDAARSKSDFEHYQRCTTIAVGPKAMADGSA
jgi:hypothetical protein